jgi:NTE family protein
MNQPTAANLSSYQSLSRLFGDMNDDQLKSILAVTEILEFDAGEYLFQQGETGHAFYIVLSGRFRALQNNEDGLFILGDISVGEPIGELSLFTKEKHSASIVALRKSSVLRLEDDEYTTLVQQFPSFANTLTKFVIDRLRRNALQKKIDAAPKNIAVINLQPDNDVSPYTEEIKQQLQGMGFEINIYDHSSQSEEDYYTTFDNMEKQTGLNFLVCDSGHPEWARQCIAYCDLVIVATGFSEENGLYEIEKQLNLYSGHVLNKKIYLLLLHPENAATATNTRRWFEGRSFDLHLHIRKNNLADIRRFCRIVTHQATGLVLGGGGARGFAHVGVVKALLEAGVEIDFIGGTSAGGIFGAGIALSDFDMQKLMQICQAAADGKLTSNDYRFPFISLMSGKKIRKFLKEIFKELHLEDLWVNTFCISTNFSNASLKMHERGLASQQIEASIAIPGVFPPVIIDQHLHIDGGIIDNLPVESMHKKPVRHIIAVSLSAEATSLMQEPEMPSSWKMFWNKMTNSNNLQWPGLSSILINSITINSRNRQEMNKSQVALYLELDLKEFKFLDWTGWQQIIQKGYEQMQTTLKERPEEKQFWK